VADVHLYWSGPGARQARHAAACWRGRLWTDADLPPEFLEWVDRYQPLFLGDRNLANWHRHRSNLVRYRLLRDLGGTWVDCDLEPCPIPVSTRAWVGDNYAFGGPRGHPLFVDLCTEVESAEPNRFCTRAAGAELFNRVLARHPDVYRVDVREHHRWDTSSRR
jgi:hypothetical protein